MPTPKLTYNPLELSPDEIQSRLQALFDGQEWVSHRALFRKPVRDYVPLVTNNIILILGGLENLSPAVKNNIETAKRSLSRYQKGHLTYFWPLKNGKSRPQTYNIIGRIIAPKLSPDADDSCIQQLTLNQRENSALLLSELEKHRAGINGFKLCHSQAAHLKKARGSYLAFFAGYEGQRLTSNEVVDLGSDMHILWFLKKTSAENTAGYAETVEYVRWCIKTGMLVDDPLLVSPYYANAPLLIYMISRAVKTGGITELNELIPEILQAARTILPENIFELVCLMSAFKLYGGEESISELRRRWNNIPLDLGTIYIAPYFFTAPYILPVARMKAFRVEFYSEALLLAMTLRLKSL